MFTEMPENVFYYFLTHCPPYVTYAQAQAVCEKNIFHLFCFT